MTAQRGMEQHYASVSPSVVATFRLVADAVTLKAWPTPENVLRQSARATLEPTNKPCHVLSMIPPVSRTPPVLDMSPDGTFRTKPSGLRAPLSFKLLLAATIVAVMAGAFAIAALALWVAALLLPVVIIATGVAFAAFKYRQWRRGGRVGARSVYPR